MSNVPRVLRHNVCVKMVEQDDKTPGGIYIPQTRNDTVVSGQVVAVGTGHLLTSGESTPVDVAVGETVMFHKADAIEVESGQTKYWVLPESSIICVP